MCLLFYGKNHMDFFGQPNESQLCSLFLILLLPWRLLSQLKPLSQNTAGSRLHQFCPPPSCWHNFAEDNLELHWLLWESYELPKLGPLWPLPSHCSVPPCATFSIPFSSLESFDMFPFKLLPLPPFPDFSLPTSALQLPTVTWTVGPSSSIKGSKAT